VIDYKLSSTASFFFLHYRTRRTATNVFIQNCGSVDLSLSNVYFPQGVLLQAPSVARLTLLLLDKARGKRVHVWLCLHLASAQYLWGGGSLMPLPPNLFNEHVPNEIHLSAENSSLFLEPIDPFSLRLVSSNSFV